MNAGRPPLSEQLEQAMAAHRAGRMADAAAGYEGMLAQDPGHFDALNLLGVVELQSGHAQRAIDLFLRALAVHPDAHPAVHHLGLAHMAAGQAEAAVDQFARAIALAPDYAPAHESLARLRHAQGRLGDAAARFETLVRLRPGSADAHSNLGAVLGQLGRNGDALASFEHALAIDPAHPVALLNSAQLLQKLGRPALAVERFQTLLAQQPKQAEPWYQAGFAFYAQGMRAEAQAAFATALALDPLHVEARWASAIAELPLAYGPGEEPAGFRTRFSDAIGRLDDWFDSARTPLGHRAVGNQQPFYLAFHEVDNLPLLTRYGDLCARLMHAAYPEPLSHSRRAASGGPVRVAVVSGHIHDQSVWTALVRGWCAHFDRRRIEVHLLHTGIVADAQTALARAGATSWVDGLTTLPQWVAATTKLQPDVLLYPEIGMDAMSARLASLRLAPVQVVAWGHPQTSGLPTIDYFLSAEAFEPSDGASHYREQLVALPNLGCCYDALDPPAAAPDWRALGVDASVPRLVCAGTPYKYMPEHDHVLVEIARRLGRCQLLFFVDMAPRLSRQVGQRLEIAFRREGLDADRYVRFLPRQSRPAFFGLMRDADVYLDTFGFSGFNSAMQAVECELPVVTCEGRFMRGRLASGVLRRMRMDELVATDRRAYVDVAVRLCEDVAYRLEVGQRIAQRRQVLFGDLEPVRALEAFLCRAVAGG